MLALLRDVHSAIICRCGETWGMENFYANGACVNTALVIIVVVGSAGIIILALATTVACLACSRNKLRDENE